MDVIRARQETAGCGHVVHLNNAGAALMPEPVVDAIISHIRLETCIGSYEAAEQAHESIHRTYAAAASLLGCSTKEIAIVENATRAWTMALSSIPFSQGERILISRSEYISNYLALLHLSQRAGVRIEIIPNDEWGQVSVEALSEMIDEKVKLIAIPHVATNSGLVNPIATIGALARQAEVLYMIDASQTAGQIPLDVRTIYCDWLVTAGRKYLRGPRGTGLLYVRENILHRYIPPMPDIRGIVWETKNQYTLRQDAHRFETWEVNLANKIGLGVAIDYALQWGIEAIWERISYLAAYLRTRLNDIPEVLLLNNGVVQCGIVTFNIAGQDPEDIRSVLLQSHINISVSQAALACLDMEARGLASLVRASLHYYNTEAEIDFFCQKVASLVEQSVFHTR